MNWLWIYLAAVAGGIIGFLGCALISVNRERITIYHIDSVIRWIVGGDVDKTMTEIVRRVYDGRKHLAFNPPKGKRKYGLVTDAPKSPGTADPGEGMAYPDDPPVAF